MNRENTTNTSDDSAENPARKIYQNPKLVIYGNISEITRAVDMNGMADGGGGGMNRT